MEISEKSKFAVIGAGSWGTTLANLLAEKGYPVTLWVYESDLALRMQQTGINDIYLPGVKLSENLSFTSDLQQAVTDRKMLLFVSPSQVTRQILKQALSKIDPQALLVCASKGIENDSLLLMSQVFE